MRGCSASRADAHVEPPCRTIRAHAGRDSATAVAAPRPRGRGRPPLLADAQRYARRRVTSGGRKRRSQTLCQRRWPTDREMVGRNRRQVGIAPQRHETFLVDVEKPAVVVTSGTRSGGRAATWTGGAGQVYRVERLLIEFRR